LDKQGFPEGINACDLNVAVKLREYVVPAVLHKHREQAINLFKAIPKPRRDPRTGEWENDKSARIVDFAKEDRLITIQPTHYFEQVATNLTADRASGGIGPGKPKEYATIRNLREPPLNGLLPALKESNPANTLGMAAIILTEGCKSPIPTRGTDQAVMSEGKGRFHCSASGVFE
jgi:hypothetical protein